MPVMFACASSTWRMVAVLGAALLTAAVSPIAGAQETDDAVNVKSPNGRIAFALQSVAGQPTYSVTFDDEPVVAPSKLGLRFAQGPNLDTGFAIGEVEESTADETWEQPWGEKRLVRDHHNAASIALESVDGGDAQYSLEVRVFDTGVGFRYMAPDTGPRIIVDEITEFSIDAEADAWWTPAGEFNRYEYVYETTQVKDAPRSHTPFTARQENGVHIAIHEAALLNYGGAWLDQRRDGVLEVEIAPRYDGTKVHTEGAFTTPWRVIQIAPDAAGLINGSDIYLNLNEPNALGDVSYVEPDKYIGIWWGMHIGTMTWGSGPDHGATDENTRRYIDFAADHGFSGVLVEGWNIGWDGDWYHNGALFRFAESYPDFDLPALAAYAAERGVRIIGHHETSGDIANYESQLDAAFDLYDEHDVRVVKTGYVADGGDLRYAGPDGEDRYTWHDGQESVEHHIRVLKAAHERGIAINAHEPVKDTGLRRTYPNWINREGARGQEFNAWGTPPNPPEHLAILPYTRMLSGPMDFTPGIFDLMPNGPDNENRVETTLAKQLALYVILHSPVQMAADLPENYEARMDAFQFIKDVVADWEHTIALQGEVGDYIVMARQARGGDEWFLGAVTDEDARDIDVPLTFLEDGETYTAQIYRDGDDADWRSNPYSIAIEEREVTASDALAVRLATSGGVAVRFVPHEIGDE